MNNLNATTGDNLQDSRGIGEAVVIRHDMLLVKRISFEIDEALNIGESDLRHHVVSSIVDKLRIHDLCKERFGGGIKMTLELNNVSSLAF